jgi:hypothetical protein
LSGTGNRIDLRHRRKIDAHKFQINLALEDFMKNSLIIFTFSLVLVNSVSPCETGDCGPGTKFIKPSRSYSYVVMPIKFEQQVNKVGGKLTNQLK